MKTIREWQKEVYGTACKAGWYDGELGNMTPLRLASMIALMHSELSEALEDIRHGRTELTISADGKPEGFPSELADVVIRVLDLCECLGIDLEAVINLKNQYNLTRAHKHGGKAL